MKICLSAESATDLTKELEERFDIHTVPFTILLGDNAFLDGKISNEQMFEFVAKNKTLPKTSAVNEYQFNEHFSALLKNYDAVIHFSMAGKMSCAYQNSVLASKNFENVYVVDTKSLSGGIVLVALYAKKLIESGKYLPEQIVEMCKERLDNVQVSLILNKLDYLRKGGRCSAISLLGANLLQLHPQIVLSAGKLSPQKKYRGNFDKCVENYCKDTLLQFPPSNKEIVFLAYTTLSENAILTAEKILKDAGFKEIIKISTGSTISSHTGPNAMGILYWK